jgi:hypothetical protein
MNYRELISQSNAWLQSHPSRMEREIRADLFGSGARWMFNRLNEFGGSRQAEFNLSINFGFYGFLKYSISLSVFFISAILLFRLNIFLLPLSIFVFYLCEIHFLFLFPLLIDNVKNPLQTSIRQSYKTGILKTLFTVMPIGFYMVAGLFRPHDPLRNWYVGCMAIIIWYQHEVRNRV